MRPDPRRIVADGYDAIAERYLAWSAERPSPTRSAWLRRAVDAIPPDTDVLDLGCGAGVPMTRALAEGRRVTGVDLSARQVELARTNVPDGDVRAGRHDRPRPPAGAAWTRWSRSTR